jgi:hypothetical protein
MGVMIIHLQCECDSNGTNALWQLKLSIEEFNLRLLTWVFVFAYYIKLLKTMHI